MSNPMSDEPEPAATFHGTEGVELYEHLIEKGREQEREHIREVVEERIADLEDHINQLVAPHCGRARENFEERKDELERLRAELEHEEGVG